MKVTAYGELDWTEANPYCFNDGSWSTHAWVAGSPSYDEKNVYFGDVYHINSKLTILRVYRARIGQWDNSVTFGDYRKLREESKLLNLEPS